MCRTGVDRERGIIAREFTLKLPDGGGYSDKNGHLPGLIIRERRAMARMIITRRLKSYDINACDSAGYTPLTMAAMYGEEEMLRLLCERADVLVNEEDETGYTALYRASIYGRVDVLSFTTETALHRAAMGGHLEVAALLIERGAKVNLVDRYGGTLLDLAHQTNQDRTEMIALLKSKGAKRASELPQPST